jgi:hypothetical protein
MRFVIGPPPPSDDFHPQETGWHPLREPSSVGLITMGTLIGLPVGIGFAYLWSQVQTDAFSIHLNLSLFGRWAPLLGLAALLLSGLATFLGLIVVHELLHALACPRLGLTRSTVVGVWPSRLMPYAGSMDAMPCWRHLLMALAPIAVLSVLPLMIASLYQPTPSYLAIVSTLNAFVSGGDLMICLVISSQVPLRGMVRNQGWSTWWRPAV